MASSQQKPTGLLDLPPEIRTQIYSNVLKISTISTGSSTRPRQRVPAKKKVRLLLVNKLILAEALPVFYKHHTVSVPISDYPRHRLFFPIFIRLRFDLLVNIEIVFERTIDNLDTVNSDIDISQYLGFVKQTCPFLKTLLLELRPTTLVGASKYKHYHWRSQLDGRAKFKPRPQPSWELDPLASPPPGFVPLDYVPPGRLPRGFIQTGPAPPGGIPPGFIRPGPLPPLPFAPPPGFALPGFVIHGSASSPPVVDQQAMGIDSPAVTNASDARSRCKEPHVIDKNGKTVLALRSMWQRLDKLMIVLPAQGDFGLPAFAEYVIDHLLRGVEPEMDWWLGLEERHRWTNEHTGKWTFRFRVEKGRALNSKVNIE